MALTSVRAIALNDGIIDEYIAAGFTVGSNLSSEGKFIAINSLG